MWLRSALFNIAFQAWTFTWALVMLPILWLPARHLGFVGRIWARVSLLLLRVFCGIRYELRGREYIPKDAALIASKHQSAWDTLIFWILFQHPVYILKKELLWLPLFGLYLWRMGMIAINRAAGSKTIKKMTADAKDTLIHNRPIVIFPEGTRRAVDAPPDYQPGIGALYRQLGVPVTPVALNSGHCWGRNAFRKTPGTIKIAFLPPIAPGMKSREFLNRLESTIETATNTLP